MGKTAVVTGGAAGIGRELYLELARRGCRVFVADINREGAGETVARIAGAGENAEPVVTDMRDPEAVDRLVAERRQAVRSIICSTIRA